MIPLPHIKNFNTEGIAPLEIKEKGRNNSTFLFAFILIVVVFSHSLLQNTNIINEEEFF
jgi:hypothetical protein